MGKVSESIWSNSDYAISLSSVSHIEKDNREGYKGSILIVFKHSKYNNENEMFDPHIWLKKEDSAGFREHWGGYLRQIESKSINDLRPLDLSADNLNEFFNDIQNICKEYK